MNWEIITSLLSIIIGIWVVRHFLLIPDLRYSIETQPFVITCGTNKAIKNKLKILYNNQNVEQISIATVTIKNNGWGIAKDFSSPVRFIFNSKILSAYPDSSNIQNGILSEYTISQDGKVLEFNPNYINQKESIIFKIVMETQHNFDINVTGRCNGCSTIKKQPQKMSSYALGALSGIILAIITCFFLKITINHISHNDIDVSNTEKTELYKNKIYKNKKDVLSAYLFCQYKLNYYLKATHEKLVQEIKDNEEVFNNLYKQISISNPQLVDNKIVTLNENFINKNNDE